MPHPQIATLEEVLHSLRAVDGVQAAMVVDHAGAILVHRPPILPDPSRLQRLGRAMASSADAARLLQDDWELLVTDFGDRKLVLRSLPLGGVRSRRCLLAVIGDAAMNLAFLGVALRVAASKLRTELEAVPAASDLIDTGLTWSRTAPSAPGAGSSLPGDVGDAPPMIHALFDETAGAIAAVPGTRDGELRAIVGSAAHAESAAATVAVLLSELTTVGSLLGLSEPGVASLRSPTAARVFARQRAAVLAFEVDPRHPLGELEARLRHTAWAPDAAPDVAPAAPAAPSAPIRPSKSPITASTLPPPVPRTTPPGGIPLRIARTPGSAPMRSPTGAPPRTVAPRPSAVIREGRPDTRPTRPPPMPGTAAASGPQVFAGDLDELALPDLLEFLRNSQRSGLLVCSHATGIGKIRLSHGMVVSADSPRALGVREHLLARRELAPAQRDRLAALPPLCFDETRIVDELTARDLASRDDIERARIARIYSAFREMLSWTSGRFSFDPAAPIVRSPALALSARSILMQIYQEQDDTITAASLPGSQR
jgi:predicted regulator of Ras-like GTPase activity (Roadblock/LC7/MglB family)